MNRPDILRRRLLAGLLILSNPVRAALTLTPSGTEGPFYPTPSMRLPDVDADLVLDDKAIERDGGEVVMLSGRLLDQLGDPIANARVEIWQCDTQGRYLHTADVGGYPDDTAFQGFGFATTDTDGQFRFRTIKPTPYTGRTPHIHLKALVDGEERLTTQLYLPDHPDNAHDWLYQRIPRDSREQVTMHFKPTRSFPEATVNLVVS